ncbi:hypothetical protein FGO68_gene515 [Halteria grandinella]|uniref:Uncharacterized protein n=1 Tax=Halteria grandinella TaxID=5974 RepID=A0A8J8NJQ3_HALGN|nr:hypothetical protein FGO68_gene515 [Halteria grandinella]
MHLAIVCTASPASATLSVPRILLLLHTRYTACGRHHVALGCNGQQQRFNLRIPSDPRYVERIQAAYIPQRKRVSARTQQHLHRVYFAMLHRAHKWCLAPHALPIDDNACNQQQHINHEYIAIGCCHVEGSAPHDIGLVGVRSVLGLQQELHYLRVFVGGRVVKGCQAEWIEGLVNWEVGVQNHLDIVEVVFLDRTPQVELGLLKLLFRCKLLLLLLGLLAVFHFENYRLMAIQ